LIAGASKKIQYRRLKDYLWTKFRNALETIYKRAAGNHTNEIFVPIVAVALLKTCICIT